MPVSSATEPSVVAGALAARVREGVEVALSAIGVDAVGNAMRAICFARLYLEVGTCFLGCGLGLHGAIFECSQFGISFLHITITKLSCLLQNDNLDIKAMPEFVHVVKANIPMSSLVFHIVVENAL